MRPGRAINAAGSDTPALRRESLSARSASADLPEQLGEAAGLGLLIPLKSRGF
jgi:hypothetical protein